MIESFSGRLTEELFRTEKHRKVPSDVWSRAGKQFGRLDAAVGLEDLYFPRSNRFKRLAGFDPPRYSIRVNDRYRITQGHRIWRDAPPLRGNKVST